MIIDLAQTEIPPVRHTSVCIAGAGAAGICLAVELAKSGVSVTVLESGGIEEERATQDLYSSEVAGVPHRGIHEGRFRVLGGSTTHWAGQILEFDAQNFETRAWVPHSGWPFPKEVLTPYYRRALELEGLASCISDDHEVWKAARCVPPDFGDMLVPFFSRWCPEPNFAVLHGQVLRDSSRVMAYLHANVCEILLAEDCRSIAGLRCRTLSGRSTIFTADRYVFCLGGIESARLLLQPLAETTAAPPWNVHGLVGRYFQDHIYASLFQIQPRHNRRFHQWFDNVYRSGFMYFPYLMLSAEEQRRLKCLAISAGFLFHNGPQTEAIDEFRGTLARARREGAGAAGLFRAARNLPSPSFLLGKTIRRKFQGRAYNPSEAGISMRFHCEQSPDTGSRVELSNERDALGMFRTRLHWTVTDLEIHTMRQFSYVIEEVFRRSNLADLVPPPAATGSDDGMVTLFEDAYHHMGTTRMADSAQYGVVDTNLRLFGVLNGYVCSSSVFPSSGFANPTHTLIALAARLAEHLAV